MKTQENQTSSVKPVEKKKRVLPPNVHRINLTANQTQFEQLEKEMSVLGYNAMATMCMDRLMLKPPVSEKKMLNGIYRGLTSIGQNENQIARHMNLFGADRETKEKKEHLDRLIYQAAISITRLSSMDGAIQEILWLLKFQKGWEETEQGKKVSNRIRDLTDRIIDFMDSDSFSWLEECDK